MDNLFSPVWGEISNSPSQKRPNYVTFHNFFSVKKMVFVKPGKEIFSVSIDQK
jgi:hypothetical protein